MGDDWSAASRDGARRAQLRRALSMSVRERLQALEDLTTTARALHGTTSKGAVMTKGASIQHVAETHGPWDTGAEGLELAGCRPAPLGSYLKALGVFRLVAEQVDPNATAHWRGEHFVLHSALDTQGLVDFLANRYVPTPILAPWNGGSGFYASDNQSGIDVIATALTDRFALMRTAIEQLRLLLKQRSLETRPSGQDKAELLTAIRAVAGEELVAWLDAAVFLAGDDPRYPPLLGTGGNDGRLDFTNNFMQRLVELIDADTGQALNDSSGLLLGALFDLPTPGLAAGRPIGQFMPAAAGGPNATTGFDGGSLINPWDFVLMLEGALLCAAAATRRHAESGAGHLSYPFTVRPAAIGSGSAALADEQPARAEMWLPLWERPTTLAELRAVFGEGRATLGVGGRPARDGLDFARAIAALGVERGFSAFQRHAFFMRAGKAYLATPLDRVTVQRRQAAELVDQLDRERFLDELRRSVRSGLAPAALRQSAKQLEDAIYDLCTREAAGASTPRRVQRMVEALGDLVLLLRDSRRAREGCRRLPRLGSEWFRDADDASDEFRIAAALAGLGADDLPMLNHLLPLEAQRNAWAFDETSRHAVWGRASLGKNMASVLARRRWLAEGGALPDKPLAARPPCDQAAIAALLREDTDERRIARLLCGLSLVGHPPRALPARDVHRVALPAAFAALKPLFTPDDQLRRIGAIPADSRVPLPASVPRLLMAGRTEDALAHGLRRLRAAGIAPKFGALRAASLDGERLLLALLLPIHDGDLRSILSRLRTSTPNPDDAASPVEPETTGETP